MATDYTCIPFTEETDCDYYVIPGEAQKKEFIKRKIPKDKLLPFGIPVRRDFGEEISMESARDELKLAQDKRYVLMTGGSIGVGSISKPGGLSSTEAAVLGTAYIHITPIPGCETKNMRYFSK